jgi:hypothetical protein
MTLAIDCTCGAHLEIDGKFAGQTIQCPDCQQPLQVPLAAPESLHTSGFALASLILAIVGAFTVVGTIIAILLGIIGLRSIARNPARLTGNGFALTGIVLGVVLTALSLFAYARAELFGLDRLLREQHWAGKLEYDDATEITSQAGFSIPRPSKRWGRLLDNNESFFVQDGPSDSIILVNPRDDAYAIGFVFSKAIDVADKLETDRQQALEHFVRSRLVRKLAHRREKTAVGTPEVISTTKLREDGVPDGQQVVFDIRLGKHDRTFVMQILPRQGSQFVVAAGARKNRFSAMEAELRKIVSKFRITDRGGF